MSGQAGRCEKNRSRVVPAGAALLASHHHHLPTVRRPIVEEEREIAEEWKDELERAREVKSRVSRRRPYCRSSLALTSRQAQMMSKHRDTKTVMRYDHGRENLERKAVNFSGYDDE